MRPREPSAVQAQLHRLQLELFHANQKLINETVEGSTEEFRRYEARYHRTVRRASGPARFDQLLRDTRRARVTLVGDYHTFRQAQRAFFRLLRAQPEGDGPVLLGVEMLRARNQVSIDRFQAGGLTEEAFLRRVQHHKHWPFGPFESLRPVFDLARERGWRVLGLDHAEAGQTSLAERDRFAAEVLAKALAEAPGARAFVLVGEMHLAPGHLPRAVEKALARHGVEGEVLRVHQNPEAIWFDYAARGLADEHDVLALGPNAYALLTASPVVCQQSFLTWLELSQEGGPEVPSFDPDAGARAVAQAVDLIGRTLDLDVGDVTKGVEVVGPADLSFFERLQGSGQFTAREMRQIRAQILASESYYVPKARLIYLATLSTNHAAEEASHLLRHHASGEGIDDPKGLVDAFYSRVMNEAIGFLGSKIVSPKRKGVPLSTLLARARGPTEVEAARCVIEHKRMEQGQIIPGLSRVFHSSPELFNAVTHLLGYLLGEKLYYALVRGKIPLADVRGLYTEPFEEDGAALLLYFELAARVGRTRVPARS